MELDTQIKLDHNITTSFYYNKFDSINTTINQMPQDRNTPSS